MLDRLPPMRARRQHRGLQQPNHYSGWTPLHLAVDHTALDLIHQYKSGGAEGRSRGAELPGWGLPHAATPEIAKHIRASFPAGDRRTDPHPVIQNRGRVIKLWGHFFFG